MAPSPPSAKAVFDEAIEIASLEERRAYLDRVCADAPDLRQMVEALLTAYQQAGSFLESPVAAPGEAVTQAPTTEQPGTAIGPYKLIEQIGEGGMGTVWMAQQTEPVKRLVAVKLIKAGMDSRQVIARFEAERQALALMDHPNIARVLDGGTTAAGRPFFVMDLVKGVPVTKYCDDHRLTPRQRLELFLPVCRAVQHAHQKGIIHRDLKPSNVLVAQYDGRPVPKVIDFGVAKATGQSLTDKTLVTGFGNVVGTLEYMSPEQAEVNQLDIDTRSDIYSLGVVLYELLAGSTPFTKKYLGKAGILEMLRVIREVEPSKPSAKLSTAEGLPTLAANRGTEPAKLTKLLRGELDWIVMKALEKDRNRRYETANGFAMDVQRYLADEAVLACPPSAGYRLRKFARRHRRVLAAAFAFMFLLVTGLVALSITLVAVDRERRQKESALEAEGKRRQQARAALDAMTAGFIRDWLAKQTVLLREHKQFLAQALIAYEEFAADTGQDEASRAGSALAYERVGYIRALLGEHQDAEGAWERGRTLYVALVADFPNNPSHREGLAEIYMDFGDLYRRTSRIQGAERTSRIQEAEKMLEQSLTIYRSLAAEYPETSRYKSKLATALTDSGMLLKDLGRAPAAIEIYGQALVIQQQLVDADSKEPNYRRGLAQTYGNLGYTLNAVRRSREGEESLKQAAAMYQQLAADYPGVPDYLDQVAVTRNNIGQLLLQDASRHPEAEEVLRQTLTLRRQLAAGYPAMPEYRRGLAITLSNLGIVLKDTERPQEAEEMYRQALAIHKQLATDSPAFSNCQNEAAGAMNNLARLLYARADFNGARRLLEEALPYHQAALKANARHPDYRRFYRNNRWRLAETFLALKDHTAAAAVAKEFLDAATEPPRDAYTAACLFAGCARLAAVDQRLVERKRQELATAYGDSAVGALREAVDLGAKEVSQLAKDPALDPLRSRPDFKKLLAEWEAKQKESRVKNREPEKKP
jgi:serine/threonine protein kinase